MPLASLRQYVDATGVLRFFPDLGRYEKVAWSVPIQFEGKVFWIEHRKLGLGIFIDDPAAHEGQAEEIVKLIKKGVKEAAPFYAWLARQAVDGSTLNVSNRSKSLFSRFEYLLGLYKKIAAEAAARTNERHVETRKTAPRLAVSIENRSIYVRFSRRTRAPKVLLVRAPTTTRSEPAKSATNQHYANSATSSSASCTAA